MADPLSRYLNNPFFYQGLRLELGSKAAAERLGVSARTLQRIAHGGTDTIKASTRIKIMQGISTLKPSQVKVAKQFSKAAPFLNPVQVYKLLPQKLWFSAKTGGKRGKVLTFIDTKRSRAFHGALNKFAGRYDQLNFATLAGSPKAKKLNPTKRYRK